MKAILVRKDVVKKQVRAVWDGWDGYWFESNRPNVIALFRLSMGVLLASFYVIRGLDLDFYFSENGI